MNLSDNPNGYGLISRATHWLAVALIFVLIGIGLYFGDMPRGDEKLYWLRLHVAIGTLGFVFLAFRVLWRVMTTSPRPLPQPPLFQSATKIVHGLLLLGIAVMLVTGPLTVWSDNHAIEPFGWFTIPSPLGDMPRLHEALEDVHAFMGEALLVLIGLHVAAVLKHTIINRDGTLARMLGRGIS